VVYVRNDWRQTVKWLKRRGFLMAYISHFIWRFGKGMYESSSFQDCWHNSRKKTACLGLLSCLKEQKLVGGGGGNYNRWWNMGLWLWSQNLAAIITMEIFLAMTEKSMPNVNSKTKGLLIVFFDYENLLHHEYGPQSWSSNQYFCLQMFRCLRDVVHHSHKSENSVSSKFTKTNAYTTNSVWQFLAKHCISQVKWPPNSPDMAPYDSFKFPKLKKRNTER